MAYIQESIENSLLFPATNVTEDGRLISPPYRFFCLSSTSLVFGLIGQKRGFKYFVDEGYLCRDAAKKFIKIHNKHNLWDKVGVIDRYDQRSNYQYRKAMIYVKSRSAHDTQAYHITLDKLSRVSDGRNDIIKRRANERNIGNLLYINITILMFIEYSPASSFAK